MTVSPVPFPVAVTSKQASEYPLLPALFFFTVLNHDHQPRAIPCYRHKQTSK